MADIFTDEAEDFAEDALFSDADQEPADISDAVPEIRDQSEVPVQSEQDAVEPEAGDSGDLPATSNEETDEGVETVPASDTVEQIDYTELLQQQNEYLESLVMETREMNYKLDDLSHAMPIMACMLGFVAGVLLVQIFSSYLRV